jgi:hypothetical protein
MVLTFCRLYRFTLKISYLHLQQCESRLSRCLHLRGAKAGQKAQVSVYTVHRSHSKLKVSSISYLLVYASTRLPETQPESTNTPDLGQINGSDSANTPDSNDFIGLDALLQVLQSANAGDVVSPPPPDSFDFSRSYAHVSESAVQVAATAVNQLSQQAAPDIHYPGPFDSMTLSVRFFSMLQYISSPHNLVSLRQFHGFGSPIPASDLQCNFPNQKITTFLLSHYFDRSSVHWLFPVIHRPCFESCYRTCSSGGLPPSVEFIALLAITCATALQFLPETDEDVRFLSYLHISAYIHVTVGYSVCRLHTGEESPAAAPNRFLAFCAIILHRFNLSSFVTRTHSSSEFVFHIPMGEFNALCELQQLLRSLSRRTKRIRAKVGIS